MEKRGLSGNQIKWIAMILMFLDHIGAVVLENACFGGFSGSICEDVETAYPTLYQADIVLRLVGRPAFLLFCYFIAEGLVYTHNRLLYALRLFVFALISETFFNLAMTTKPFFTEQTFEEQNVFFTLALSVLAITLSEYITLKNRTLRILSKVAVISAFAILATEIKCDYSASGVFCIAALYYFRGQKVLSRVLAMTALVFVSYQFTVVDTVSAYLTGGNAMEALFIDFHSSELFAAFAFLIIDLYNGERGKGNKYLFYAFYPAHLLVLFGIAMLYYH